MIIKNEHLGIDLNLVFTNRNTVKFEKQVVKLAEEEGDIFNREYWEMIVQFAIDAGIVSLEDLPSDLEEPKTAGDVRPGVIKFMAETIQEEWVKAIQVSPE